MGPKYFILVNSAYHQLRNADCFEADLLQLRTCNSYNEQVAIIEMDPSQKMTFGIRYDSPFNQRTFHVVGRLPPDIMHDFLEGTVPLEMALVLQQLVAEGYFTLQQLNLINYLLAIWHS